MKKIENTVKKLIIESLRLEIEPEELVLSDLMGAYSLDSVKTMEILVSIESEFFFEFEPEEISPEIFVNFETLMKVIRNKIVLNNRNDIYG